jgi:hypothetical protein
MSTTTSFCTRDGCFEVKYIPLRPPIDSPISVSEARPSWSATPVRSPKATTGL